MFFSPFGEFCYFPYAHYKVPSEQIILLCNEAVQSSLPLIAYKSTNLTSSNCFKIKRLRKVFLQGLKFMNNLVFSV